MASDDAHRRRLLHNGCAVTSLSSLSRIDARLVLFLRQYSLKRAVVRNSDQEKAPENNDLEKALTSEESKAIIDEAPVLKSTADEEDDIKTVGERDSVEKVNDYEQEGNLRPATASTAV
jgi:hypothetical protein